MSANFYDTVITTTTNDAAQRAYAVAAQAAAVARVAQVAAQVALNSAARGSATGVIQMEARAAALSEWGKVTGSVEGYASYEPSIFREAALKAAQLATGQYAQAAGITALNVGPTQAATAQAALSSVGSLGLGALFGGAGTAVILGAGALILLVLLKR